MKLKGVNPIEQHIEKIVLALMLVLLLGVLAMQFVQRPNDIDVGNRTVSPDQVFTVLESQANLLNSQITDLSPTLPELKPVDLVERYNSAFENASGGTMQLSAALGKGVDITGATGTTVFVPTVSEGPVAALTVPITSTPVAASMWSTLDPYAVVQVPEFEAYIPAAQPFDFPSVSIEASFNGKDLEAALMGQDGGNAIPRRFWSANGLAILGFEAQRQRLNADGSWGAPEPIETPPHTPTPTQAITEDAGLSELTELVSKAGRVIDEIARPMFPPTIAGAIWEPPSEQISTGNEDSESTEVTRLKRRLSRAQRELDRLTNAPAPRQNTGGGKTGRDSRTSNPPPSNPRNQNRIDKLRTDIKDLEDQLTDLGVTNATTQDTNRARTSGSDFGSILEEESIDLWAHDLGVEPGATYRYRTRVVVNNPLFRKSSELDPDDAAQQALAMEPFARGQWSQWSDQIVVGAKEYFFVTKAEMSGQGSAAGPKATIEVYKMYYGHYRRSTLSASPGDGLSTSVRMSGDLLVFDPALIEAQEAAKAINAIETDPSAQLPEGISELPKKISIELGIYLLDIYTYQGQSEGSSFSGQNEQPMRVVLRDREGGVIVRSDISDESSQAYELASSSSSRATNTPLRAPGAPAISPAAELFEPQIP
jgi:hypothetical protein